MQRYICLFSIVYLLLGSTLHFSTQPAQSSFLAGEPNRLIIRLAQAPLAAAAGMSAQRRGEYAAGLASARQALVQAARGQGLHLQVRRSYQLLLNGMAVMLPPTEQASLAALPGVVEIYPDARLQATLDQSVPLVGAPAVWALKDAQNHAVDGTGMRVAIIDSGVDYTHPDLGGCLGPTCKVAGGYDFVNLDANPLDDYGHGTHVAGIVAAKGSLKGVAPGASLLAYKVLDNHGWGYMSSIIAALEMAADPDGNAATPDGASVANLSLGGTGSPTDPLSQAVDAAVDLGMVVVVSAGNDGSGYQTLNSPGVARNALTVGASDKSDIIAGFSSRGPVDGSLGAFKPEVLAPGVEIHSPVPAAGPLGDPTRYRSLSGTSMAAPHVAGAAALLRQLHPGWTPAQVKAALMNSAKKIGQDLFSSGAGRIQADRAATLPILALPGSLAFGSHAPGAADARSLTLENVSAAPVEVAVSVQLAYWFDPYYQYSGGAPVNYLTPGSSAVSLPAGESASLSFSLSIPPDASQGFYFGSVLLDYGGGSISVPIILAVLTGNYPPNPNRLTGQLGGLTGTLEVRGDLAYVGLGPRMGIVSVKDKAHPALIGQTDPGPGLVWAAATFDHYAVVAFNGAETGIFDITTPGNIFRVGTFPHKNVAVQNIRIQGQYAYLTANMELWILDISDPANPWLRGRVPLTTYGVDLVVDGNRAYISEGYPGVQVVDITNPNAPQVIGVYDSNGYAWSLAVANHLVYLGDMDYSDDTQQPPVPKTGGLRILDFSNPANPHQTGYFDTNPHGYPNMDPEVVVQTGRAYLSVNRGGGEQIFILDVSKPAAPAYLADFNGNEWPDHAYQLQFQDGFLYSSMPNAGVDIFDLRNVQAPVKTARISVEIPYVRALARQGSFLYLAEVDDLAVYDVTDPARPVRRGVCRFPMNNFSTEVQKVVVAGRYVYIAAGSLKVCDVSNPDAPLYVTALQTPGWAVSAAVSGAYIYIAEGGVHSSTGSGLSIYKQSGRTFQPMGRLAFGQELIDDIAIKENSAYLTSMGTQSDTAGAGLHIVDIQNPSAPQASGFLSYPNKGPSGIAVVGSYAYLTLSTGRGLVVLDVSNPGEPQPAGSPYFGAEQLQTIVAGGNYAYMVGSTSTIGGVFVFDISIPAQPQKVILYPDYCGSVSAAVSASTVYMSSWGCGMQWGNFSPRSTYRVTGQVRNMQGNPIPGVFLTDSLGNLGISDANGQYEVKNVLAGRNTLAAYKAGCSFTPAQADFTASSDGPGPDFTADDDCPWVNLYLPAVRR